MTDVPKIGSLRAVAFDAADHRGLARFYVGLTGGTEIDADDDWVTVETPDGWRFGFQPAPDHVPPQWPSQAAPQQMHVDFQVPDIDAAAARAEELGATRIGGGETWHVMADPAGHPFCLSRNEQSEPVRVFGVNIDAPDPTGLATFYQELLGMDLKYAGDEGEAGMAWIGNDGAGLGNVLIQGVRDYTAPRWPDPAYPQQLHLDIEVADVDEAEARALKIGATRLPGEGADWRVYADPAGHPFCLVW